MLQIIYLLFAMSLSGTAAFLLYLATTSLLDSYISAGMRYLCLKICMLFFLIPFPILKHLFVQLLLPSSDIDFFASKVTVYPKEAIIQTANGFYFPFSGSFCANRTWHLGNHFIDTHRIWILALLAVLSCISSLSNGTAGIPASAVFFEVRDAYHHSRPSV